MSPRVACFGARTLRCGKPSRPRRAVYRRDAPEEEEEENDRWGTMMREMDSRKGRQKDSRRGRGSGGASADARKDKKKNKKIKRRGEENHKQKGRGDDAKVRTSSEKNPDVVVVAHNKQKSVLRKKVDPEIAKYFSEIANLFESNAIDLDERPSVCANALDETRGKEVELATDMVISHTLQTLLEGCELEQVCGFLRGCADNFASIAMDRYGSHVLESALKSLSLHLQDMEALAIVEDILTKICKVVAVDPVGMMCNSYGSHVVRSLLCLCKGIPLDYFEELHSTKTSIVLAGRLNIKLPHHGGDKRGWQEGFQNLLKHFALEMLRHAGAEVKTLCVDKYGSFVLQVLLKSLVGYDHELARAILFILGCSEESISEGLLFESSNSHEIQGLLEDTAASHLVEVILEVAPDNLFEEILQKIFRGSLYETSSHHCGNFAVQALISSTRSKDQMDLVWEEIGSKIKELLESRKAGVVASLCAACHRLETHRQEFCRALAHAVHSETEGSSSIIPRLLFLDCFLCHMDKSTWQWPLDSQMHVLGCLILQTVFKFPSQYMQLYAKCLVSLEANQVFKMAKDAGGSHVLESFLCSDVSAKVKLKVISRLHGHFGELSLHPSGSFTVEKCFTASNLYFKEAIVKELSVVKDELTKTKHGPHVIKNLDIDRYMKRPELWKSSQASRETIYREYQITFGSQHKEGKGPSSPKFNSTHREKRGKGRKRSRSQDDSLVGKSHNLLPPGPDFPGVDLATAKLGFSNKHSAKQGSKGCGSGLASENPSKNFIRNQGVEICFVRRGKKRKSSSGLADLAVKRTLSSNDTRKLLNSSTGNRKKMMQLNW